MCSKPILPEKTKTIRNEPHNLWRVSSLHRIDKIQSVINVLPLINLTNICLLFMHLIE